jgi:CHAT domain-containing protein
MRRIAEDFSDELTPEEETMMAEMKSNEGAWQQQMARRMSAESRTRGLWQRLVEPVAALRPWPNWAFAATAAMALVAIGVTIQALRPASPMQLLAAAYTEQRSLELRFPSARYAPLRVLKGGAERSRLERPAALLEAEASISRGLANHPDDVTWLQAKGRADLLDWNYESAIKSFKRALEVQPDSPALQMDLAMAYFERAESADRAIDYGTTIELLAKSLKTRPDDPVTLFNYAIALERMFLYQQAIETWRHYLRVDSKSDWAVEARRRLAELEQKKKSHEMNAAPAGNPGAFLRRASMGDVESEDYLDVAISDWLPASDSTDARAALQVLADLLVKHHRDRWLADLLKARPSPDLFLAVASLGRAVRANLAGNPAEAEREARIAQHRFRTAGSHAGTIRASLEEVYALHRSGEGKRCLATTEPLTIAIRGRGYAWAEAQLLLEKFNCFGMFGDLGAAQRALDSAAPATIVAGYRTLRLRGLGMEAALPMRMGNYLVAWRKNRAGLAEYWAGSFPPIRAHQFYSTLTFAAEALRQWHVALEAQREVQHLIAFTSLRSGEAMAHHRLAVLATMADQPVEAAAEFDKANRLFSELPRDAATRRYQLDGELALAALETLRGEQEIPLGRLSKIRTEVLEMSNYVYPLRFHRTLGALRLRRGEDNEAEQELRSAIQIAERSLLSIQSEHERLTWDRETGEAYRLLVRLYLQRQDSEGSLRLWQWYRAAALRSVQARGGSPHDSMTDANSALANVREVTDILPYLKHETVVSYAQFPDVLAVWVFDDRGITAKWIPITAEALGRLAQRFVEQCSDSGASLATLQRDGKKLYELLIAPIAARLAGGRTLVIEPDGSVSAVPFQALVDPSGQYLGTRFAMVSSPGVWHTKFPPEKVGLFAAAQSALVVGPPAVAGDLAMAFPPLVDAVREARLVASQFDHATLLSGKEATREALERGVARAEVFHFSGHGIANPDGAGLLLASPEEVGGAIYGADELRRALLQRCRLAVLSACSTGIGEKEGPVNPDSLVRAFLSAGVRHVVASRWNIDAASTADFFRAFYEALLTGGSVAGSLQTAATRVYSGPGTGHPFYWAGLNAFGQP